MEQYGRHQLRNRRNEDAPSTLRYAFKSTNSERLEEEPNEGEETQNAALYALSPVEKV